LLTTIAAACRDQRRIRLSYLGRDSVTTRNVEPHYLVHTPRRWYLLAWDTDRGDWRTFRVDRIQGPLATPGARFTPRQPPADDVGAYVSQSISSAPYRYQARILIHASLEAVAQRSSPRPDGWKPPAWTPASSTQDRTPWTNSPFSWPSKASTSKFSTHPSSSPSCAPWPNASAKPPTFPNGSVTQAGNRARRRPAQVV
jgi:WYL domain